MNKALILQAIQAGRDYGVNLDAGWFPCGFAGVAYKCRKNAKEAKVLIECGFRWSDYHKSYRLSAPEQSQSLNAKEMVARFIMVHLRDNGMDGFTTYANID